VAAYPSLAQWTGSKDEWTDDIVLDRAVSGGVKARAFFTAKKRRFTLKHRLTAADRTTLETFYNANRLLAVTLTWAGDGNNYTCLFEQPPRFEYIGSGLSDAEVSLAEQ
jgi:hypothetical protein